MGLRELQRGIAGLAKHVELIVATGDAAHSLLRPDEEELEDIQRTADDPTLGKNTTRFFETRPPKHTHVSIPTPPLPRAEQHLFQFFLDGSAHGRSLGMAMEGERSYPVALFQVGAAVIRRDESGHLFPHAVQHQLIETLPGGVDGISDTLYARLKSEEDPVGSFVMHRVPPHTNKEIRAQSNSVAFSYMHNIEVAFCDHLVGQLSESCRAIIDGSIKLGSLVKHPYIIGVAKSFWTMPQLKLQRRLLNLVHILARLPVAHRTPVFQAAGGTVGFWYLRLRPTVATYPLEGVVKVEVASADESPVESDEADLLSRALMAERTCSAYGLDKRWPRLLYPIHHAEEIIKWGFISEPMVDRIVRAVMFTFQS